jgi:hypothetical protein
MSLILDGSNGLSDVDGSAATPAIRGTDTNTGIFFPAADTIAFSEGGVESMRIDSSGNVGIGTTSPTFAAGGGLNVANGTFATMRARGGSSTGTDFAGGSDGKGYVYVRDNAELLVGTNNTERMRITSNGDLLLATTSGNFSSGNGVILAAAGRFLGTCTNDATIAGSRLGTDGNVAAWYKSTSLVGSISVTGSSTAYNTSSDYRLKENITPMTGALDVVQALKPVTYNWKVDGSSGQGFIAHELQEVVPDCVVGEKDAMRTEQYEISPATPATYDDEGNEITPAVEAVMGEREVPVYQGIDTSFLVATLTASIQELKAIVDAQAARIAALENPPVESVTNE